MKLYLIGGFLGSGKTTAIQHACIGLLQKGLKVGVITNDQGIHLVDTNYFRSFNIPALEVTDGCFCCNYDKLSNNIQALIENNDPEIIFAESVGSCTDLVATVVKPLLKFHPDIAVSVCVFADARVLPVLIKGSGLFIETINYIYRKQLEEADFIVVSKIDMLSRAELENLQLLVKDRYPDKMVLYQSSLNYQHIQLWLEALSNFKLAPGKPLECDYDIYGAGEAELAWFDSEMEINSTLNNAMSEAFSLTENIYKKITQQRLPVGHLKIFLNDEKKQLKLSFTVNTPQDFTFIPEASKKVEILINARVQTTPFKLKNIIADAIQELKQETGCIVTEHKVSAFQPGYPKPTHRIDN